MRDLPRDYQTVITDQSFARSYDSFLAVGRQGELRAAGVAAVERPFRLAVADDEDSGGRHDRKQEDRCWDSAIDMQMNSKDQRQKIFYLYERRSWREKR